MTYLDRILAVAVAGVCALPGCAGDDKGDDNGFVVMPGTSVTSVTTVTTTPDGSSSESSGGDE
ncbi:MAG TPA: hypothetical protein VGB85_08150, partial [Nannocystis sp.]